VKEVGRVIGLEKGKLSKEKNGERLISLFGSFHQKNEPYPKGKIMSKRILVFSMTMLLVGAFTVTAFAQKVISVQYGEPWKPLFESAIEEFEETTGAKVDRIVIPYGVAFEEKMFLDLAAGAAGDVVMVDGFMIADTVEAGYVLELDDYVEEWADWDQYYPAFQAMGSYKGHVYGITLETAANAILWYWKPNFEKAGIPMPWKPRIGTKCWKPLKELKRGSQMLNIHYTSPWDLSGEKVPLAAGFTRKFSEPIPQQAIVIDSGITRPKSGSEAALPSSVPLTFTARYFSYGNYVRLRPCMLQPFGMSGEG